MITFPTLRTKFQAWQEFEARKTSMPITSTQNMADPEFFSAPMYQSTQFMWSPKEKPSPRKVVSQRADKHHDEKLKEEGPKVWVEPTRTPIVTDPEYEIIYNLHNGKHTSILTSHNTNHEGIMTREELRAYEANHSKFQHGFRVAIEGNIGSGKCGDKKILNLLNVLKLQARPPSDTGFARHCGSKGYRLGIDRKEFTSGRSGDCHCWI